MADSYTYWRKREEEQRKRNIEEEKEYEKEIQKLYKREQKAIEDRIYSFYSRYASQEGISMADAKKRVSKMDVSSFADTAKKYVKEKDFSKRANEELKLYNLTMKINYQQLLQYQLAMESCASADELEKFMQEKLEGRAIEEIERQAGILGESLLDQKDTVNSIVNASFHNATFSDRIWANQAVLRNKLDNILTNALVQGRNPREYIGELTKAFDVSRHQAERLLRTELARVQIDAQMKSYDEMDIDEYIFHALGDACDICKELDHKHFKIKDGEFGKNLPPMHPNCRCSTGPYMDTEEFDKWLDSIDEHGLTWEEWKNAQLELNRLYKEFEEITDGYGYDNFFKDFKSIKEGFEGEEQSVMKRANVIHKKIQQLRKSVKIKLGNSIIINGQKIKLTETKHGFSDGKGGVKKVTDSYIYKTSDGTRFVFPKNLNPKFQTMTPEKAIELWQKVPENIRAKAQETIEFVDYYNPLDPYWRKKYKNFTNTYAAGGDKITFYRFQYDHDDDYVVRTYCHEVGHFIDKNVAKKLDKFSDESEWLNARIQDQKVSGLISCTPYGENSNTEDFAESVSEYTMNKENFKRQFPNRASILDKIL